MKDKYGAIIIVVIKYVYRYTDRITCSLKAPRKGFVSNGILFTS